ncbi:MAG: cell division protein FtsA [Bacteroidales bacterium]|nr:cell division protein FtsA [Bacteroidales bacterium]
MSQKENFIAAIDIGTTKIVAIVGRKKDNGKLEILGLGNFLSSGVKRGVVLNIDKTVNSINEAVNQAEKVSECKISNAFVGIAGQHIRSIRNRGYINRETYDEEISSDDVQSLIEDMHRIPVDVGEEIIHVLPQSFIVDNETGVKSPVGMFGKRLEANFHIVIGQIAAGNNIKKCINRSGLKVNKLILEPLASSNAVLTEDEKEVGVTLIDIGGGTTDVAVFYDGIIRHTAVIPYGGNVITNDIKIGCSILERQAEALKIKFGSALADEAQENKVVTIPGISGRQSKEISFKSLAHIIQSRMEEIISEIYFEIETSGFADKLGAGIVITGGGALLKNLPQLVAYKTGMDVRIGFPNEYLTSDAVDDINQPKYATAIGLILKGYEDLEINEEILEEVIKEPNIKDEEKVVGKQESKKKILNGFLDKFSDMFDVDDGRM